MPHLFFIDTFAPSDCFSQISTFYLELSKTLGVFLSSKGHSVILGSEIPSQMTPSQRAVLANQKKANLYLSISPLIADTTLIQGSAKAFVYHKGTYTETLADAILTKLQCHGIRSFGVYECHNLTILRRTSMPAIRLCITEPTHWSDTRNRNIYSKKIATVLGQVILGNLS